MNKNGKLYAVKHEPTNENQVFANVIKKKAYSTFFKLNQNF